MTKFSELGLAAPILKALESEGYDTPTAIQAQAIPVALAGRDVLGIAQTGTGKTAAFALPILQRLATDRRPAQRKGCRALILSPTRELATQIADSFHTYGRLLGITVAVVLGGVGHRPQAQRLMRGVDVLVATPGRLLDHLGEGNVALAGTEVLVLDEADQMLDLGFLPGIRRIVSHLTAKRQSLFFSATMPREIGKLAEDLLSDPARISVTPVATPVERIAQQVLHVESQHKLSLLVDLLGDKQMSRALVFTRTKRGADRVARHLEGAGIRVAAIHGNKSQPQRRHALEDFRNAKVRVLVATDIAARGIDIDGVTHVVNYELPDVPESYVHRIGRTARAGADGIAISLCGADERIQLRDIERLTRQSIPAEDRRKQRTGGLAAEPEVRRQNGGASRPSGGEGRRNGGGPRPQGAHGKPQHKAQDRSQGRSQDRHQNGYQARPQDGRQDRPHQDRPHQDRPHQDRSDRPRSGPQGRRGAAPGRHKPSQPGAHPGRRDRNGQGRRNHQGDHRTGSL